MELKKGDKIKIVGTYGEPAYYNDHLEKIYTVKDVFTDFVTTIESVFIRPNKINIIKVNNLKDYDLKKAPLGTKITFKNGDTIIKNGKKTYSNSYFTTYDNQIYKEIIAKIEEPEYKTVYANVFDVLDEKERKYLKDVIRPFRNRVKHITKRNVFEGQEVITICIDDYYAVNLPLFEKGTMYIGMETDKNYTLEDLNI